MTGVPAAGDIVTQLIMILAGGGAVTTAVNAWFSRRATRAQITSTEAATGKTTAEITQVGAGAAAVLVDSGLDMVREARIEADRAHAEADRARAEADAARREVDAARREVDAARRGVAAARAEVDYLRGMLTAAGVHIPARPPDGRGEGPGPPGG